MPTSPRFLRKSIRVCGLMWASAPTKMIMEIQNNKEQVPFAHYVHEFKSLEPMEAVQRLGVAWNGKAFSVKLLGTEYYITHPEYSISPQAPLPVQTFLLRYLLKSKAVAFSGTWKTFREMPWGELYIKPYTGRVLTRAAFTFGTRVEKFKAAAEKMGAFDVKKGDAGFVFDLIGNFQMQILVWAGDEEFPPNAQVLYSDNFENGFEPEDRVVAGDLLISSIKSQL